MSLASIRSAMPARRFAALGFLIVIAVALYFLVFNQLYYKPRDRERADVNHNWLEDGFSIAVVWPPHTDKSLVEGVTLALEELNASNSFLRNKIKMRLYVETSDKGAVARELAEHDDVLAVVGHELVGNSIPASITYEEHGIVFISPKITDQRLTHHQLDYTFRLTPDDEDVAKALAQFALDHQWNRVGVLYGRILRHQLLADQFVAAARRDGISVPFNRSFFHATDYTKQDFRTLLGQIRSQHKDDLDAILLADDLPWAGKVLLDLQQMGFKQPILGSDKLDSAQVWTIAQTAANNLYVASAVNPSSTHPNFVSFSERFTKRFGAAPGYGASQGYEAITLLVAAIERAHSADPIVVATTLKTNTWTGLFGDFTFDTNGDIMGRDVTIKKMTNGVFQLAAVLKEQ